MLAPNPPAPRKPSNDNGFLDLAMVFWLVVFMLSAFWVAVAIVWN